MTDYNFFSIYEKKKGMVLDIKSPYFAGGLLVAIAVLVALVLVGLNLYSGFRILSMTQELDSLKANQEYQDAVFYQQSIQAMSSYDRAAQIALDKFNSNNKLTTVYLAKLASFIPDPIVIKSLTIDNANLSLSCSAVDRRAIAELIKSLNESGLFLNTIVSSVMLDDQTQTFNASIYCIIKDGEI